VNFSQYFFCVTQLLKPLFFCIKASEIPKKIFLNEIDINIFLLYCAIIEEQETEMSLA